MGDFTVLMTMDMDVRSNWEVMTRLVPKTAGATSAHQSKLDGGVKHLLFAAKGLLGLTQDIRRAAH